MLPLRPLALHDRHRRLGARFAPFAGWEMPVQYGSVLREHAAVRTAAGLFDVSHLSRVWLRGAQAARQLRALTTANVLRLQPGQAQYSLYCTDQGRIADDIFIYHIAEERWLIVHNAANAEAERALAMHAAGCPAHESVKDAITITWSVEINER